MSRRRRPFHIRLRIASSVPFAISGRRRIRCCVWHTATAPTANSVTRRRFGKGTFGTRVHACCYPFVGIQGPPLNTELRSDETFDAEGGDFVEGDATMLESMVRRPGVAAEGLTASPASILTTLSQFCPVEALTDDRSGSSFSRQRAFPVCAGCDSSLLLDRSTIRLVARN